MHHACKWPETTSWHWVIFYMSWGAADWPVVQIGHVAPRTKMAHPCVLAGCSAFGLGSRRRNGYGPQGLSIHAEESGPWTNEGGEKKQNKVEKWATQRVWVGKNTSSQKWKVSKNEINQDYIPSKSKENWTVGELSSGAYCISIGALCWWCSCISISGLSH